MAEELFDVVDAADRVIGTAPRSVVHANRWLHRAVHIFVFNTRGELLIHKRSATKDEHPSVYNSSASGHLHAGEDYAAAAARELEEELGLTASLEFVHKFAASPVTSYEFSVLYRAVTDAPPRFDPEEIECGAFYAPADIAAWIARAPADFAPGFAQLFAWYTAWRGSSPVTP